MTPQILTILQSLAPVLVILYLAWKEYKSGDSAIANKIRSDYKERNEQLEKRVGDLEQDHIEHSKQITRLETILEEKDKQIEKYEKIFANRNPDLTDILADIKVFMKNIYDQNKYQTGILENRQLRDKKIDDASAKHKGAPMRAPVTDTTA